MRGPSKLADPSTLTDLAVGTELVGQPRVVRGACVHPARRAAGGSSITSGIGSLPARSTGQVSSRQNRLLRGRVEQLDPVGVHHDG